MFPDTLVEETVVRPAGSCPFAKRASHSQPTRLAPIEALVPPARVPSAVYRQTRFCPWAAFTTMGKKTLSLSPMYITPTSAFSGLFAPAGSRQVPVGSPVGSGGPPWVVL